MIKVGYKLWLREYEISISISEMTGLLEWQY
jgi:hypothetical protein